MVTAPPLCPDAMFLFAKPSGGAGWFLDCAANKGHSNANIPVVILSRPGRKKLFIKKLGGRSWMSRSGQEFVPTSDEY